VCSLTGAGFHGFAAENSAIQELQETHAVGQAVDPEGARQSAWTSTQQVIRRLPPLAHLLDARQRLHRSQQHKARFAESKMMQSRRPRIQTGGDVAQSFAPGQLSEDHADELLATR
jgi:hypothetical protein